MRVDKNLRRLLLRQPETQMLDKTSCMYRGREYTFAKTTPKEIEEVRLNLLKIIDKKSWAESILSKLGF